MFYMLLYVVCVRIKTHKYTQRLSEIICLLSKHKYIDNNWVKVTRRKNSHHKNSKPLIKKKNLHLLHTQEHP